jgi:hypothetical protein
VDRRGRLLGVSGTAAAADIRTRSGKIDSTPAKTFGAAAGYENVFKVSRIVGITHSGNACALDASLALLRGVFRLLNGVLEGVVRVEAGGCAFSFRGVCGSRPEAAGRALSR